MGKNCLVLGASLFITSFVVERFFIMLSALHFIECGDELLFVMKLGHISPATMI